MKLTKENLNKNIYISDGNIKLRDNGESCFFIFNLPAVETCPSATPSCRTACYAMKAERQYPGARNSRARNYKESLKNSFVSDMIDIIEWNKNRSSKKHLVKYFRIHESGDLYNLGYFKKWCSIARYHEDINFMLYTKSINIIKEFIGGGGVIPDNLVIKYSVWSDTSGDDLITARELGLSIYGAVTDAELKESRVNGEKLVICGGDCMVCKLCYIKDTPDIHCLIH